MSSIEVANVEASKEQPLNLMVSFIEQEALEKMEEIETRANEEFVIEKGRLVEQNMEKIDTYYERKLKQVDIQQKIQASNAFNQARLECLRAREQHLEDVLLEAEKNLETISSDDGRYPVILKGLILQALFQLLEKEATIVCRQKDVDLVKGLVGECLDEVEKASGVRTAITIEQNIFLSPESAGGVEASSQGGKIKVSSTLESRLRLIADQIVPQVRTALFGSNPNRRFFD
ncbi:hypothetical protein QR680_005475 [Steinernema hermaphroditum]|uniref:V-type proton ATPase subunit E n=1 Tax=Steinernema hermaphroditum TaxID=289476 RepID=A0AA39LVF1_9BILA|nr:hypothetical protein QR680_005475 [Steinernema hermaphroditum]